MHGISHLWDQADGLSSHHSFFSGLSGPHDFHDHQLESAGHEHVIVDLLESVAAGYEGQKDPSESPVDIIESEDHLAAYNPCIFLVFETESEQVPAMGPEFKSVYMMEIYKPPVI